MSNIADLRYRIDAVRRKEKNVVILAGVCRCVLVLIGVVIGYFLIDLIFDLPYAARLVLALLSVGAIGYSINRFLLREMGKTLDDDTVALRVEARNPDLRGRLISTLQLSRAGERGEYIGSKELYEALELETGHMSRPLDFFKIINKDLLFRLAVAAVVVIILKLALVIKFPGYFEALGQRLVSSEARFPTRTRIREIKAPEFVARGDEINVDVTLDDKSDIPSATGYHNIQFVAAGKSAISVDLAPSGGGAFSGKLMKAMEDVDVIVWLGDTRQAGKKVKVLARPEVDANGSSIQFHAPAYMKIADPARAADPSPDKFGPLTVLAGSTADFSIASTKPLRQATLERSDGKSFPLEKKDAAGKLWGLAKMPVEVSGAFHLNLTDTDNLRNSEPAVEYPIEAKPDYPPTIKIEKPNKDQFATTTGRPAIVFNAHDDFRVRMVWLVYTITPAEDKNPDNGAVEQKKASAPKRFELPGFTPGKNIEHARFSWDNMSSLNLKPGDQLQVWLEADDDCEANDWVKERPPEDNDGQPVETRADGAVKSYARSQYIKYTIVTKEDWNRELLLVMDGLKKQWEAEKVSEEEIQRRLGALLDQFEKEKDK